MFLVLSGEGPSDIGTTNHAIGPMTQWVDVWLKMKVGYSVLNRNDFIIIPETEITQCSKEKVKALSRRGKRQKTETRYFYKNARALALLAASRSNQLAPGSPVIAILFRDADGSVNSGRREWQDKWNSILLGFEAEKMHTGVPMIPKPKSEAWILCALKNNYQNCRRLEDASGNDASPKSLKVQLENHLGESASRELLNAKIDSGELDIQRINDMPSLTAFKERLDEVLTFLGY